VNTSLLSLLVVCLYLLSAYAIWHATLKNDSKFHLIGSSALILGWGIQAYLLHILIDTHQGQNLSMSNLSTIISWFMLAIIGFYHSRGKISLLMMVMLVISAIFQTISEWFPSQRVFSLASNPNAVIHIISSLFAYSLLALAALQAVWIWWLDSRLKQHMDSASPFIPSLLGMEKLLFQFITVGFIVFSVSILYALFFLHAELWEQPLHKLVLSFASWFVFGLLLVGHLRFGWRGKQAATWTLSAFLMLALAYFGVWAVKLWLIVG